MLETPRAACDGGPAPGPWLRSGALEACFRAKLAVAPVLLRAHVAVPLLDPWSLLGPPVEGKAELFAISEPGSGLCALGLGNAHRATFGMAHEDASPTLHPSPQQVVDATAEGALPGQHSGPVGFAALPFDGHLDGPWEGWAAPVAWLPERLIWRQRSTQGTTCAVTVQRWVRPGETFEAVATKVGRQLEALLRGASPPPPPTDLEERVILSEEPGLGPQAWCAQVADALDLIRSARVSKLVPARAVRWRVGPGRRFDALGMVRRLRAMHPQATCFAVCRDGAHFLGATPETLVRLQGRRVESQALAGTTPHSGDVDDVTAQEALLGCPKERWEHRLVVDSIRFALQPWCGDLNVASSPRLRRLRGLAHLETPIWGSLAGKATALELARSLHPTPAVCGTPTDTALSWLRQTESTARGLFAGPVGWWSPSGDGAFAVAIRSALVKQTEAWAWAGAGVVQGSHPMAEWHETRLKLRAISRSLVVEAHP